MAALFYLRSFAGSVLALPVRSPAQPAGAVSRSNSARFASAASRSVPHISGLGCNDPHTAGRSGDPKIRQRYSRSRFTHGTPAGFPSGIPGIGDEIEGAMQQAPHPGRQVVIFFIVLKVSGYAGLKN